MIYTQKYNKNQLRKMYDGTREFLANYKGGEKYFH